MLYMCNVVIIYMVNWLLWFRYDNGGFCISSYLQPYAKTSYAWYAPYRLWPGCSVPANAGSRNQHWCCLQCHLCWLDGHCATHYPFLRYVLYQVLLMRARVFINFPFIYTYTKYMLSLTHSCPRYRDIYSGFLKGGRDMEKGNHPEEGPLFFSTSFYLFHFVSLLHFLLYNLRK